MSSKLYDIVIYGATGYTGMLTAEYLAENYGSDRNIRWAIAGRSQKKLAQLKKSLEDKFGANNPHLAEVDMLIADVAQPQSLDENVCEIPCVSGLCWSLHSLWRACGKGLHFKQVPLY